MFKKAYYFVLMATTIALAGCGKREIAVSVQKVDASNVALITRIGEDAKAGDLVQLREIKRNGCTFFGSVTHDFAISVTRTKCGDTLRPASFVVPLSRTHTYSDADGALRPGYGGGETFAVADVGIDFSKVRAAATPQLVK